MVTLASSDPAVASVAPFGGRKAVYTPDPLAAGILTAPHRRRRLHHQRDGGPPALLEPSEPDRIGHELEQVAPVRLSARVTEIMIALFTAPYRRD
jgi:hypothetical protein